MVYLVRPWVLMTDGEKAAAFIVLTVWVLQLFILVAIAVYGAQTSAYEAMPLLQASSVFLIVYSVISAMVSITISTRVRNRRKPRTARRGRR